MSLPKLKNQPFKSPEVKAVFDGYPRNMKSKLLFLRNLIYLIAAKTEGVGDLEETLKWSSPSYLTTKTKSGTTLRIDRIASQKGKFAVYVHCQTTLIAPFKKIYKDLFEYDGNRALILDEKDSLPVKELSHFIYLALTYHLHKKQQKRRVPDFW